MHYLHHLVELEVHERRRRCIERNQRSSELPSDKTLATLNRSRLPTKVEKMLPTLCEGTHHRRSKPTDQPCDAHQPARSPHPERSTDGPGLGTRDDHERA